ncbi:hypothetical protein AVEN_33110-1 [Araneus ventricosus]|uniref:Uncharacterized protein n=1 Tax=Araneus ventricosus TaxID=182803 RepID=A0A4Y2CTN3_ARAVE|nr:hypothetical protein AVEN_33110-1 [Araneus ventricosus]
MVSRADNKRCEKSVDVNSSIDLFTWGIIQVPKDIWALAESKVFAPIPPPINEPWQRSNAAILLAEQNAGRAIGLMKPGADSSPGTRKPDFMAGAFLCQTKKRVF